MPRKQPKRAAKSKTLAKPKQVAPPKRAITKKKKTTKKKKASTRKTKPSYLRMVMNAILQVQEETSKRKAVSYTAICKYLEQTYPVPDTYKRFVRNTIKQATLDKYLAQTKLSYRVTPKLKAHFKKKTKPRASSKKKNVKKTTKTTRKRKASAATKTSPTKKRKTTTKKTKTTVKKSPTKKKATSKRSKRSGSEEDGELRWVWQYKDNGWYNYDIAASEQIEDMYLTYKKTPSACDVHAVDSGEWQYNVDFRQMEQMNKQHNAHTTRKIRRFQVTAADYIYPSRKFT